MARTSAASSASPSPPRSTGARGASDQREAARRAQQCPLRFRRQRPQADLQTFAAMGVHATSTLTAITAQDALGVSDIFGYLPDDPRSGRRSGPDFGMDAAKTGMQASSENMDGGRRADRGGRH